MQNLCEFSDADLVALAKQGDARAFAELASRSRPVCYTIARSIVGDHAEAEDQVQTALLNAWRGIGQFREDSTFTSWMFRIVTNECLMVVRRRSRAKSVPFEDDSNAGAPGLLVRDRRAGPEEILAARELSQLLHRELRRLPAMFRTVLMLAELHGWSVHTMAVHLGISVAATKSRLTRARRELRNRMRVHRGRMAYDLP